MDTVELSVNAYAGDLPFFEKTFRHLIRQTSAAPLSRRRIVVDRRPPTGRFATNHSSADLDAVLSRLLADGVVDDVDDVDWSTDEVERVAAKYFGRADAPSIAHG